jgi:hypothetical protein
LSSQPPTIMEIGRDSWTFENDIQWYNKYPSHFSRLTHELIDHKQREIVNLLGEDEENARGVQREF